MEPPTDDDPIFHPFSSEWLAAREQEGLAKKTIADLKWSLCNHLLPFFAGHRLSEITVRKVDRYKTAKASEGRLSNNSVNHTLSDLAQVLETAVEYGLLTSNPASGKRRRLKGTRPNRPWVEPEQLMALLDAAPEGMGRTLLSLLAGAGGPRIAREALSLRWRHIDFGTGTLHVVDSKTPAGVREVDLTPALQSELLLWAATTKYPGKDDYVFPTSTGRKHNPSNLRRDVLKKAVEKANVELANDVIAPIGPITFHSFRRTYVSLRCACGDDVRYVASQVGHEDVRFTLRVYAQAVKRRERMSATHREAFDRAVDWARMGTNEPDRVEAVPAETTETSSSRGF